MNREQAKEILLLYRPGQDRPDDPELKTALALVGQDPELGHWFEEHRRFQEAVRASFRAITPPPDFRETLLGARKVVQLPSARSRAGWWAAAVVAAAALFMVLGVLGRFWPKPGLPDKFDDYRAMMISRAILQYGMEFKTNNMSQLRQLIASKGAPADYALSPALEKLPLTGGGTLQWRSNPVAMVCFDRGTNDMIFLFVMNTSAVKDPPSATPWVAKVNSMVTASWTNGNKTYLMASRPEPDFPNKYY
jgi:hypothetical protein